jgi:hypothetical protein
MRVVLTCVAALGAVGCSSTNISDWVGNWNAGVSEVTTCPSGMTTTQLTGVVAITAGTATDTIVTTPATSGCPLNWTVSGNGATLESGQHCVNPEQEVDYSSGGLTLNGNSISVGSAGTTSTQIGPSAPTVDCSFNQVGTFTRGT